MSELKRKIMRLKYEMSTRGLGGIARLFLCSILANDIWLVGKVIELRGDYLTIDGCKFSLKNLMLSTAEKSSFLVDYEIHERQAIRKHLDSSLPVVELGGGMGVVACVTNRLLKNPSQHVVVEANEQLIPILEENRRINDCRFTIIHAALAYDVEYVTFYRRPLAGFAAAGTKTKSDCAVQVKAMALRDVVDDMTLDRFSLVVDIEGSEVDLIENEAALICERVDKIVIELHPNSVGQEEIDKLCQKLSCLNFEVLDDGQPDRYGMRVVVFEKGLSLI